MRLKDQIAYQRVILEHARDLGCPESELIKAFSFQNTQKRGQEKNYNERRYSEILLEEARGLEKQNPCYHETIY